MRGRPGSFPWLLAHDLRLNWRQLTHMFAGWSRLRSIGVVMFGLIMLHALAWAGLEARATNPILFGSPAAATVATGIVLWMIAQGLLGASRTLYERSDLDLLFASPVAPWKPVVSRAIAIAVSSAGALAPLVLPLADSGAIFDQPRWLALYPILAAMALFGTAVGFVLAIGLFQAFGPERARRISQISAAVIAGAFVLAIQIGMMLPKHMALQLAHWLHTAHQSIWSGDGLFSRAVGQVVEGDRAMLSILVCACAAFFGASVVTLSGSFIAASLAASGTDCGAQPLQTRQHAFRQGAAPALRLKEWRLLIRDPNLAAQLGLQIVYTLPLAGLMLRNPGEIPPAVAIAPLIVVLAAQIAASLAWVTVSGEDAPELIATAPIAPQDAALAKLSAIAMPLCAILLLPVLALLLIAPRAVAYAVCFGILAAISTATLNFWHPSQAHRRGLLRRHSQSKLIAMGEHGLALLWAIACVIGMVDLRWALAPFLAIVGVLWIFSPYKLRLRSARLESRASKTSALQQI